MANKNKIYKNKDGKDVNKNYYSASPSLFKTFKIEDVFKVDEVGNQIDIELNGKVTTILQLKCSPVDETQNKICESKNIFPLFSTIDLAVSENDNLLLNTQLSGTKQIFVLLRAVN